MNNDSINIVMFKETFNGSAWIAAKVDKNTPVQIKELILKNAKQLKAAATLS
jgi:Holliday junction resolvase